MSTDLLDFTGAAPDGEDCRDRADHGEAYGDDHEPCSASQSVDRRALVNALADLVMSDLRRAP